MSLLHDPIDLRCDDGTTLSARFTTASSTPRGAVLIVPAMGVPQVFYAPLVTWLSSEGFHALTFDYRGMGASLRGSLRDVDADIFTWARQDTSAALRELTARAAGLPITWLGHSLGGQIIPFVSGREGVRQLITVAAGSGYWRQNAPPLKRRVWLFWFGAVPLLTPLFGYFPGRRLGMVGDLPRGVVMQWRRWCMNREYSVGVEGAEVRALYAGVTTPMTSLSFTDDELMSEENIRSLHGFYAGANVKLERIAPREVGLKRIGHFGFFRRDMRESLWTTRLRPLLAE
ncbi:MAG: alpha/beta fold hydrolase [Deltaproteobacteria bacterium]|nr:alpha/beta fold hydrolase [Deltaproteobacteria bacterium]